MNYTAIFVASYLMRTACFVGAAVLAWYGKEGWGWLIFAGIACGLSTGKDEDTKP